LGRESEDGVAVSIARMPGNDDLPVPEPATAGSAGLDLRACLKEPLVLRPGGRALIPTGFAIALPAGYEGQVRPRSGLALREGLTLLDQCLHQVRSLSLELRPSLLDDLGLAAALRWYVERQAERAGFAARLEDQLQERRLPANVETTCFRVAQEAITNVARHARATHLEVCLGERDGLLSLLVRDDGVGFDVEVARARASAGGSLGLLGMEERVALVGGRLRVDSRPGHGTEVQVELPLVSAISPPQAA